MVSTVVLVHFTPSEPPTQRDDARPSFRPDRPDTKTLSAECEVDGSASSIPGTLEGGEAAGSGGSATFTCYLDSYFSGSPRAPDSAER